jgi:hypothetical protein
LLASALADISILYFRLTVRGKERKKNSLSLLTETKTALVEEKANLMFIKVKQWCQQPPFSRIFN